MTVHRFERPVLLAGSLLALALMVSAPSEAAPVSRFAFGSCAGQDEPQPIWDAVLAESPEVWIWAGDNVYGDTEDMQVLRAKYGRLLGQPGYQRLRETGIPILGTWDDHDFGVNDGGTEYPQKKASQQVFLDFFGVAEDSPRRQREGVYHAQTFGDPGQRVQVIVLDTRYHRSPLLTYPRYADSDRRVYRPDSDPESTVLGEEQWAWLQRQLLEPAELRLIVSSIQVVSGEHRFEKWMNFPRERRRFLDLLRTTQAEGVVVLSGDRHHAELSRLHVPDFYPLYDLTSSGLNKSSPRTGAAAQRPQEPNRHRIGRTFRGHHFGVVEVDWEQPDPQVRLSIVNQQGERPIDTTFPLSTLSLTPAPALRRTDLADPTRSAPSDPHIRIDGDLADWDAADLMAVDGEHLFLRFPTPEEVTLTNSSSAVHVLLDFDGDQTGTNHFLEIGVDLEIAFSPRRAPGERGWRPVIQAFDPQPRALAAGDLALAAGPTHAARFIELRLSRARLAQQLPAAAAGGRVDLAVYADDKESDRLTVLARSAVSLPDVRGVEPMQKLSAELPSSPEEGLRVVSLNTLWGSQIEKPEPFGRILKALGADIYLFQEWSRELLSEGEVVHWFRQNVDAQIDWQTMVSGTAGNWERHAAGQPPSPARPRAAQHAGGGGRLGLPGPLRRSRPRNADR